MSETTEPLPTEQLENENNGTARQQKTKAGAFTFDVVKLVSGTLATQVISFLASLLLARMYLPDYWGVSVVFSSFATVLTVFSCLRYENAILLPKGNDEAANVLGVSLGFAVLITLILLPVFWLGRFLIGSLFHAPELIPYAWLVPIMVFVTGAYNALNFWNSRQRKYMRLSGSRVINEASTDGLRLIWGYAGHASSSWLITSNVLGSAITTIVLLYQACRDDWHTFTASIRWSKMLAAAKRYSKFPIYTTWAAILYSLSLQLPSFLLTMYFSPAVTGYYALGQRLLRLPINLIANAIGQVFFQRASVALHEGWLARLVDEVTQRLISFGIFPNLLVALIGKEIFIVFFGNTWAEAGIYSQILSFWTIFLFLASPLAFITSLLEKQEATLYFNIVVFLTRALTLWFGAQLGDSRLALWLFSLSGMVLYGWFCFWVTNLTGVPVKSTARHFLDSMLLSAPFLAVLALAKWVFHANAIILTGMGILMGIGYYIAVVLKDPMALSSVRVVLKKVGLGGIFPSKG